MVPQDFSSDFPYSYLVPIFAYYLVRILYVVVICIPTRLHQFNQAHSTTCLTFMICKYQDTYFIPVRRKILGNHLFLSNSFVLKHTVFFRKWPFSGEDDRGKTSPRALVFTRCDIQSERF
jgi:hypothetical protein